MKFRHIHFEVWKNTIWNLGNYISKFVKIQFEIWANTFWNWLHGLSAHPSPAFTLYRVTSVIGSQSIKSLLNLIATIPTIFLSTQLENLVRDEIWPYFPQNCKIFLKSLVELKIFRIPKIGHLQLHWNCLFIPESKLICFHAVSYFQIIWLTFTFALFGGFLTDGRRGTSAIYRWEKRF